MQLQLCHRKNLQSVREDNIFFALEYITVHLICISKSDLHKNNHQQNRWNMDPKETFLCWCNSCGTLTSTINNLKLNLTSCQHLICNDCLIKCINRKCYVCNVPCQTTALKSASRSRVPKFVKLIFMSHQQFYREMNQWCRFNRIQSSILLSELKSEGQLLREQLEKKKILQSQLNAITAAVNRRTEAFNTIEKQLLETKAHFKIGICTISIWCKNLNLIKYTLYCYSQTPTVLKRIGY